VSAPRRAKEARKAGRARRDSMKRSFPKMGVSG
jgi:hypothetical protein